MPNDEQLAKDRELLIRIDENTRTFREVFQKHAEEDASRFHDQGKKIDAVHERLDDFESLKNKIIGGVVLAGGLGAFITWIFEFLKKG